MRGILCGSELEFAACQVDGTFLLVLWMLTPAFCCSYLMGFALEHYTQLLHSAKQISSSP